MSEPHDHAKVQQTPRELLEAGFLPVLKGPPVVDGRGWLKTLWRNSDTGNTVECWTAPAPPGELFVRPSGELYRLDGNLGQVPLYDDDPQSEP
jgi:hypothetical protein